jgi:hypothetical protein
MGKEDEIRLIAFRIWQEEGCINGCNCEHWFKAEAIWEQQKKPAIDSQNTGAESKQGIRKNTKVKAAKQGHRKSNHTANVF